MPKKHVPKNASYRQAYVNRLIERLSPANHEPVKRFLAEKSTKSETATLQCLAVSLSKLDRFLNGAAISTATQDQLRDFILDAARRYSASTAYGYGARLAHYLRWVLNTHDLPRETRQALARPTPTRVRPVQPISDEERDALLVQAAKHPSAPHRLKWQAILWTLWDSGFRLGELLSLRVGSIEFDPNGGARLRLRAEDQGLKTGARTIFVATCDAALRAWLKFHPAPKDPDAYLFPSNDTRPHETFWAENVTSRTGALAKAAGVRHIHPHLFRHTAATRCARAGWNESQMRAYFGWSANSEMPSIYIHLVQADQEALVRRDARIDPLGSAMRDDPQTTLKNAVASAVAETLRQLGVAPPA